MNPFVEKLAAKNQEGKRLCVGIDPVVSKLPPGVDVVDFCKGIVNATREVAAAYKPNLGFFEALGWEGKSILRTIIVEVGLVDPTIPVIGDSKRGDIGATNKAYAASLFDQLGVDATTLHSYFGWEEGLDAFPGKSGLVRLRSLPNDQPGSQGHAGSALRDQGLHPRWGNRT